jgi:hypothetical protein
MCTASRGAYRKIVRAPRRRDPSAACHLRDHARVSLPAYQTGMSIVLLLTRSDLAIQTWVDHSCLVAKW